MTELESGGGMVVGDELDKLERTTPTGAEAVMVDDEVGVACFLADFVVRGSGKVAGCGTSTGSAGCSWSFSRVVAGAEDDT